MWMPALAAVRTFASGMDASLWPAYAGVLVALAAAVFTAAALAASAPPQRVMVPMLLVACGAGAAATAAASDQWWPLVDEMDQFFRDQFMGPQLGTYYGYPVYEPDKPGLYQAITPEDFRGFSDVIHNVSRTWTQNVNAQLVNSNLFQLPAGAVGVALVAQVGNQFWDNPVDPRVSGDDFFGINGTSGQGKREKQGERLHERGLHTGGALIVSGAATLEQATQNSFCSRL